MERGVVGITVSLFRFGDKRRAGECRHAGAGGHAAAGWTKLEMELQLGRARSQERGGRARGGQRSGSRSSRRQGGSAGPGAGWAVGAGRQTERCSGAQGRATVYAVAARLAATHASSWRPRAGRWRTGTAGAELGGSGRRMATDRGSRVRGGPQSTPDRHGCEAPLASSGGRGPGAGAPARQDWCCRISSGTSSWPGAAPQRQAAGAVETRSS